MNGIKSYYASFLFLVITVLCLVPSAPCMAYWRFVGGGTDISGPGSAYDWPDQHWSWAYNGSGYVNVNPWRVSTTDSYVSGGCVVEFTMAVSHSHSIYAQSWVAGYGGWKWVDDEGSKTPIDYVWSTHISSTLTSYGSVYDYGNPGICHVRASSAAQGEACSDPGTTGAGWVCGEGTNTSGTAGYGSDGWKTVNDYYAYAGSYGVDIDFEVDMSDSGFTSEEEDFFYVSAGIQGYCNASGQVSTTPYHPGFVSASSSYECAGNTAMDLYGDIRQ